MHETYAGAGVNIDAADRAKELIKRHARTTFGKGVLSDIGLFGGLFQVTGSVPDPVLVSSVDGVGTKLKIAIALNRHDTVGVDLVNHCVNDILTCGARPLFFLDYLAMGKLVPERAEAIVKGVATACKAVGCALIGGETAEMPGIYSESDYDLAGFIVGVVGKGNIIDGSTIKAGDTLIGVPSSGLHTNGYSLVRKIFNIDGKGSGKALETHHPELGRSLGEALLEPHRCYYPAVEPVLPLLKGIAHITGGGLGGNIPRILPQGLAVRIRRDSWKVPPIFSLIQKQGNINDQEMFLVFNMGVGLVLICSPSRAQDMVAAIPGAWLLGEVTRQRGNERTTIE